LYLSAFHAHKIKANPIVKEFYKKIPTIMEEIQTSAVSSNSPPPSCHESSTETTKNIFARFAYKEPNTNELSEEIIEEEPNHSIKIIKLNL
jgi:hypothetical protein